VDRVQALGRDPGTAQLAYAAKVAAARKLAVIMHRIWRDGTPFDWTAHRP
jgi:hypothetical protein